MPDLHGTPTLREVLTERGSESPAIDLVIAWRGAEEALTDQQRHAKDIIRLLWPSLFQALEQVTASEMFRGVHLPSEGFDDFIEWVRGGSPWEGKD